MASFPLTTFPLTPYVASFFSTEKHGIRADKDSYILRYSIILLAHLLQSLLRPFST